MSECPRPTSPGGRLPAALALAIAALILAIAMAAGGPIQAQSETALGLDAEPENNSATFVGAVQTCTEVQVGDQFAVDIYVSNVQGLAAWEIRIALDHEVVTIEDADYNFFLLSTPPSRNIYPSLFEIDDLTTLDRYFLAAAEFKGKPDSGSGVLARLQLKAVGQGRSPLNIVSEPSYFRPRLTDGASQPIGDGDGDGLWDGAITSGEVTVGEACSPAPPPSPTPPPDDDEPDPTPDAGNGGQGSSGTQDGAGSPPQLVLAPPLAALSDVASPGGSSPGNGEAADTSPADEPGGPQAAGSEAAERSDSSQTQDGESADSGADGETDEDAPPPDDRQPAGLAEESGSSFSFPLWLGGVLLATAVLGAGGSLIVYGLRNRS